MWLLCRLRATNSQFNSGEEPGELVFGSVYELGGGVVF